MILVTAATELEMKPFLEKRVNLVEGLNCQNGIELLTTGVGPVATALAIAKRLSERTNLVNCVVNFGIAGAYMQPEKQMQLELLDICLAEREVFGDLGVCLNGEIEYLDGDLTGPLVHTLSRQLLERASEKLETEGVQAYVGNFITVNSASGSRKRGDFLQKTWQGLCENMEGASIAKACGEIKIPFLEVRSISNFVEDRDPATWKLKEACQKAADAAFLIVDELSR